VLELPAPVRDAYDRAAAAGFEHSCEVLAGRLLATLSAAVAPGGRILELGTGAAVGLAWITHGLGDRPDVTVISVEKDEQTALISAGLPWPAGVDLRVGDAEQLLPALGAFDLIFADALGGKWTGLDRTIAALAPGGVLVLDDMDPRRYPAEHHGVLAGIRLALTQEKALVTTELAIGSGLILATRRRSS
jgi:demethylmenaquinone methyltransferase/2-methoxy-6-polyprenyl-1,4-benzoquinol methylase